MAATIKENDSLEKTLMLKSGREDDRDGNSQMASYQLNGLWKFKQTQETGDGLGSMVCF